MRFKIDLPTDPLSVTDTQRVGIAESQAYYSLLQELIRYGKGKITGRSILISGHRGSGKTTLVHGAVKNASHLLEEERKKQINIAQKKNIPNQRIQDRKIVLIEIHGPTLFKIPKFSDQNKEDKSEDGKTQSGKPQTQIDPVTFALKQLTIALYKGFAKAITDKFKKRCRESGPSEINDNLLARLVLDLENAASHSELGIFWRKAGMLSGSDNNENQGFKELLALASASQAYRKVVGELTGQYSNETTETSTQTEENKIDSTGFYEKAKPILKEMWSLMAGLSVFGGMMVDSETFSTFEAIMGGIAAVILTSISLKFTYSRTRNTTQKKEFKFIMDTSAMTLNREIPTLISRFKDAGFYPVFVVDELDKYLRDEDQINAFESLLSDLKHLIADRTFFCFLTDRNYFDHLTEEFKKEAYPISHTLFSRRLFIAYGPEHLHKYAGSLIDFNELEKYSDFEEYSGQIEAYFLWSIYRARFHIGDFNKTLYKNIKRREYFLQMPRYKEIDKEKDRNHAFIEIPDNILKKNDVSFSDEEGAISPYIIQITIQLAIEYLLSANNTKLNLRIQQEPQFAQTVYDALYYPSRKWETGARELDISEKALEEYLDERLKGIPVSEPQSNSEKNVYKVIPQNPNPENVQPKKVKKQILNNLDIGLLYGQMMTLIKFLTKPQKLKEAYEDLIPINQSSLPNKLPTYGTKSYFSLDSWKKIIEIIPEESLIEFKEGHNYSWKYSYFGRKLEDVLTGEELDEMYQIAATAKAVNDLLLNISDNRFALWTPDLPDNDYSPREYSFIQYIYLPETSEEDTSPLEPTFLEECIRSVQNHKELPEWYPEIYAHRKLLTQLNAYLEGLLMLTESLVQIAVWHIRYYGLSENDNEELLSEIFIHFSGKIENEEFDRQDRAPNLKLVLNNNQYLDSQKLNSIKDRISTLPENLEDKTISIKNIADNTTEFTYEEKSVINEIYWEIWEHRMNNLMETGNLDNLDEENAEHPIDLIVEKLNIDFDYD